MNKQVAMIEDQINLFNQSKLLTQTSVNENSKLTNPVYAQQIIENFDETYARTSINISIHDENLMNSTTQEHE